MTNSFMLTNTSVNGGNAIYLAVQSFTYNWNNIVGDFPIPGKNDIVANQHQGWKNPGIHIQFLIHLDDNPTGFITQALWNQIVRDTTNNTIINVTIGDADTPFLSYAHDANGTASIPISIISWSTQITPDMNLLLIDCQCVETV